MPAAKPEIRTKAIRLRVEKRLSLNEIVSRLEVSKSSASVWLRDYPLTKSERAKKIRRGFKGGRTKKRDYVESKFHRMARFDASNSLKKGKVSEAAVIFRLVLLGLNPYSSIFDGDKADILVEGEGGLIKKIQVRSVAEPSNNRGLPFVSLRCANGRGRTRRFEKGEFDVVVGYYLFSDECYVWSWDEVKDKKATVTITPGAKERWDKL